MTTTIYHLAPAERWHDWPTDQPYLPAEYEQDGFIHCTGELELMLNIANRFYANRPEPFVLLEIDPSQLESELHWEPGSHGEPLLFPHLYGPLNQGAIIAIHGLQRNADGRFLGLIA